MPILTIDVYFQCSARDLEAKRASEKPRKGRNTRNALEEPLLPQASLPPERGRLLKTILKFKREVGKIMTAINCAGCRTWKWESPTDNEFFLLVVQQAGSASYPKNTWSG